MEFEFYTANVFTTNGIRGGNQLGIVMDLEKQLSTKDMQVIAKQFNYSESTFITDMDAAGAAFKIFLPTQELSFAGHPTIGTAYVVETIWRYENNPRNRINLELKHGLVPVDIVDQANGMLVKMQQFEPKIRETFLDVEKIAKLLGIGSSHIDAKEIYTISPVELPFAFVPVTTKKILSSISPDIEGLKDFFKESRADPYVFTIDPSNPSIIHGRFFGPNNGIIEDPATGSAQAALGVALTKYYPTKYYDSFEFDTHQGYDMGRPSELINSITFEAGQFLRATTSGSTSIISHGTLYYD